MRAGRLAAVAVGEVLCRLGAGSVHPALAVLVPPLIAVPTLVSLRYGADSGGPTAAGEASPRAGERDSERPANSSRSDSGEVTRRRATGQERVGGLARGVTLAVVGHAVAVAVATSVFLLVDTSARALVYALGWGPLPLLVVSIGPLVEIGIATAGVWALLQPAVGVAATGGGLRAGFVSAGRRAVAAPRATIAAGVRAGATATLVLVGGGVGLVGGVLAASMLGSLSAGRLGVSPLLVGPLVAVAVMVTTILATHRAGLLSGPAPTARPGRGPSGDEPDSGPTVTAPDASVDELPVARLAIVSLLVLTAVLGAGAVRVTETRPTPAPAALPADTSDAYATAVANTRQTDHQFTFRSQDPPGEAAGRYFVTRTFDRTDRQYRITSGGELVARPAYASAGTGYPTTDTFRLVALGDREVSADSRRTVTAVPDYWAYANLYQLDGGELALPASGTGEWRVASRTEDQLVVTLTEPRAVFAALIGPPPVNTTYARSRIEIRIDRDRRVVTGGFAVLNASAGGQPVRYRASYTIRTGPTVDARRPAVLGPPTPGEWLWKLLAY